MKKIFTIMLVVAGTISFASAQSNNNIAYNGNKKMSGYNQHATFDKTDNVGYRDAYFSHKEKDTKMESTNRAFGQQNFFVKNDRHLRNWQKEKQIPLRQDQNKNARSKVHFQHDPRNHKSDSKIYSHDSHKW